MARANRNRAVRRYTDKCRELGHDWSEKINTVNEDSPYLPQGIVGWSMYCKRCGAVTGRGEY
jgi:hypothetical protein